MDLRKPAFLALAFSVFIIGLIVYIRGTVPTVIKIPLLHSSLLIDKHLRMLGDTDKSKIFNVLARFYWSQPKHCLKSVKYLKNAGRIYKNLAKASLEELVDLRSSAMESICKEEILSALSVSTYAFQVENVNLMATAKGRQHPRVLALLDKMLIYVSQTKQRDRIIQVASQLLNLTKVGQNQKKQNIRKHVYPLLINALDKIGHVNEASEKLRQYYEESKTFEFKNTMDEANQLSVLLELAKRLSETNIETDTKKRLSQL